MSHRNFWLLRGENPAVVACVATARALPLIPHRLAVTRRGNRSRARAAVRLSPVGPG